MMMSEIFNLLQALGMGVFLGSVFFGGLWLTVLKGVSSNRPALLFLGSLVLRTSITLLSFYFILRDHWEKLPVCLIGFTIARWIITRLTRQDKKPTHMTQENNYAP